MSERERRTPVAHAFEGGYVVPVSDRIERHIRILMNAAYQTGVEKPGDVRRALEVVDNWLATPEDRPLAAMHVEEVTVCAYTGDPGCLDCVEGEHDGMSFGGTERFTHCSCGANDVYGPMGHDADCPFRRTPEDGEIEAWTYDCQDWSDRDTVPSTIEITVGHYHTGMVPVYVRIRPRAP